MDDPLILDRYRPLAELGAGGHGSVVLAFDTKMARRVAIKQLPLPTDAAGRAAPRAGLAEARTAALLNHPNIVTVHEWDTDGEYAYIVMEHIDGLSLADILDETRAPLDLDEAAAVIEAVAAAVTYAHDNGVLHLDLKPGNVLVTRTGRIKVADFGVSALTDVVGRARGTSGTIGYMPPEQVRGHQLDERTDVWALGALAYELLTDANPFDSDTAEGSLFKIEVAEVPAPSEFEPSLSPGVDDVLFTALEPEPHDRYLSVDRFAGALLPHLGDAESGRAALADVVGMFLADEDLDDGYGAEGLWGNLAPHAGAFTRWGAALGCAWLTWSGMHAFAFQAVPQLVVTLMVALAAALAPGLGLALGLGALVAGVGRFGGWVPGIGAGIAAVAFWVVRGRLGRGDAFAPLAAPVLAAVRAAPGLPLLAGLAFRPVPAAIASAAAAVLAVAASAITGGQAPLLRVPWQMFVYPCSADSIWGPIAAWRFDPAILAVPLAWAAAAAVCSIAAGRQSRLSATLGVVLGTGVIAASYALWAALPGGGFDRIAWVPDVAIGAGLALAAVVLGPPVRMAEE